jgi:hypothetical protein
MKEMLKNITGRQWMRGLYRIEQLGGWLFQASPLGIVSPSTSADHISRWIRRLWLRTPLPCCLLSPVRRLPD